MWFLGKFSHRMRSIDRLMRCVLKCILPERQKQNRITEYFITAAHTLAYYSTHLTQMLTDPKFMQKFTIEQVWSAWIFACVCMFWWWCCIWCNRFYHCWSAWKSNRNVDDMTGRSIPLTPRLKCKLCDSFVLIFLGWFSVINTFLKHANVADIYEFVPYSILIICVLCVSCVRHDTKHKFIEIKHSLLLSRGGYIDCGQLGLDHISLRMRINVME